MKHDSLGCLVWSSHTLLLCFSSGELGPEEDARGLITFCTCILIVSIEKDNINFEIMPWFLNFFEKLEATVEMGYRQSLWKENLPACVMKCPSHRDRLRRLLSAHFSLLYEHSLSGCMYVSGVYFVSQLTGDTVQHSTKQTSGWWRSACHWQTSLVNDKCWYFFISATAVEFYITRTVKGILWCTLLWFLACALRVLQHAIIRTMTFSNVQLFRNSIS